MACCITNCLVGHDESKAARRTGARSLEVRRRWRQCVWRGRTTGRIIRRFQRSHRDAALPRRAIDRERSSAWLAFFIAPCYSVPLPFVYLRTWQLAFPHLLR